MCIGTLIACPEREFRITMRPEPCQHTLPAQRSGQRNYGRLDSRRVTIGRGKRDVT
jgi:hypothetical protein